MKESIPRVPLNGETIVSSDRRLQLTHRTIKQRTVYPARMSESERADLSRRLYAVQVQIFAGISAEKFDEMVISPPSEFTKIRLYSTTDDTIVGYCAIHRFRRSVHDREAIVLRGQAGLVPEYRGRGATYGFGMTQAALEKFKHPFTPVYYFGYLTHPSSYHLFYKYFPSFFPHPFRKDRMELIDLCKQIAETFSYPAVSDEDPFVRDLGAVTIETPHERALHAQETRRDVQYYKARNPGYTRGHGLVALVPITFANISAALGRRLLERGLLTIGKKLPDL